MQSCAAFQWLTQTLHRHYQNDGLTLQVHSVTVAVTMARPQYSGMWPIMAPSVLCEGTLLQDTGTSRWPHTWVGLIQSTEGLKKVLLYESAIFPCPWAPISVHTCACTPTHPLTCIITTGSVSLESKTTARKASIQDSEAGHLLLL